MSNGAGRSDAGLPIIPYSGAVCEPDPMTGRCATCADEALEAHVLRVGEDALAEVEMEGRVAAVAIELVEDVRAGDVLLVHAGVAIARVEA